MKSLPTWFKKHLPLLLIALFTFSCSKEDPSGQLIGSVNDWVQLEVGNYWIYDRIQVDQFGDTTYGNANDSVYVAFDTLIGSNYYHAVVGFAFPGSQSTLYIRDSAEFIIDPTGHIYFSSIPGYGPLSYSESWPCAYGGTMARENNMSWYSTEVWDNSSRLVLSNELEISCAPNNGVQLPLVLPKKHAHGIGMVEEYVIFSSWFQTPSSLRLGRRLNRYYVQ